MSFIKKYKVATVIGGIAAVITIMSASIFGIAPQADNGFTVGPSADVTVAAGGTYSQNYSYTLNQGPGANVSIYWSDTSTGANINVCPSHPYAGGCNVNLSSVMLGHTYRTVGYIWVKLANGAYPSSPNGSATSSGLITVASGTTTTTLPTPVPPSALSFTIGPASATNVTVGGLLNEAYTVSNTNGNVSIYFVDKSSTNQAINVCPSQPITTSCNANLTSLVAGHTYSAVGYVWIKNPDGSFPSSPTASATASGIITVATASTTPNNSTSSNTTPINNTPTGTTTTTNSTTTAPNTSSRITDLLNLINQYRATQGKPPLILDANLSKGAQSYAQLMADNNYYGTQANNYDPHDGPDGSTPGSRIQAAVGYLPANYGENVAAGQVTAQDVMYGAGKGNNWTTSPGHKAALDFPFTHIGIGVADKTYTQYGTWWVADFMIANGAQPTQSGVSSAAQQANPSTLSNDGFNGASVITHAQPKVTPVTLAQPAGCRWLLVGSLLHSLNLCQGQSTNQAVTPSTQSSSTGLLAKVTQFFGMRIHTLSEVHVISSPIPSLLQVTIIGDGQYCRSLRNRATSLETSIRNAQSNGGSTAEINSLRSSLSVLYQDLQSNKCQQKGY